MGLCALVALTALALCSPVAADPVSYARRSAAGASLHVLDVDLNHPNVVVAPAVAARGIGRSESLAGMVARLAPVAAVNGTYFSKRSFRPVGDIVIDGNLVCFGGTGTAVAFGADGVDFIRLPKSRHVDWSEHDAVLAGGPLLVWEGFAKPMPGGEGFGDPSVFARASPRTAVAVTADNHLLLVTTIKGTSLGVLAAALRQLGAVYAVNLDGGASAAMWYRGRTIQRPKNRLTNILCVYLKPEPVRNDPLRPPRGLDWRGGHPPRPTLSFAAGDLRVSVRLPRRWQGRESVLVQADGPLPEGWAVRVRLDEAPIAISGALPLEVSLDLTSLHEFKHSLRISVLDDEGEAVGGEERIFRVEKRGGTG